MLKPLPRRWASKLFGKTTVDRNVNFAMCLNLLLVNSIRILQEVCSIEFLNWKERLKISRYHRMEIVYKKIVWYVTFSGWIQLQFDLNVETEKISYPVRNIYDGTAYKWIDVFGYKKHDLLNINLLSLLESSDRDASIQRSRELGDLYLRTKSPIIEVDRIWNFRHAEGHYVPLFCHTRANLETKIAKHWCIPLHLLLTDLHNEKRGETFFPLTCS